MRTSGAYPSEKFGGRFENIWGQIGGRFNILVEDLNIFGGSFFFGEDILVISIHLRSDHGRGHVIGGGGGPMH